MKNQEMKCDICNKMYYIQETYGVNGSDEYHEMEIGHDWSCKYRNVDPQDRPYVKEVQNG